MRTMLVVLLLVLASAPARAQQMIEVPNAAPPPPAPPGRTVEPVDDSEPALVPTLPPPSASQPLPPPLIVPPPALPPLSPLSVTDPGSYHLERNKGLSVAGGIGFAVSYLLSVFPGVIIGDRFLAIPLAGPFVEMARLQTPSGTPGSDAGLDTLMALDAAVQLGGLALAIIGATTHHSVFGRAVSVTPSLAAGGAGARLTLRF